MLLYYYFGQPVTHFRICLSLMPARLLARSLARSAPLRDAIIVHTTSSSLHPFFPSQDPRPGAWCRLLTSSHLIVCIAETLRRRDTVTQRFRRQPSRLPLLWPAYANHPNRNPRSSLPHLSLTSPRFHTPSVPVKRLSSVVMAPLPPPLPPNQPSEPVLLRSHSSLDFS